MATRQRVGELPDDVVREIRSEIAKALAGLSDQWPVPDEAVHDARKRLKKARAGLRLVRDATSRRAFRRENLALRDAARPLSEVRDTKVLIAALDGLEARLTPPERRAIERLRGRLVGNQLRARRRLLGDKDSLKPILDALASARKRINLQELRDDGWPALEPGVRRVYRSGRVALAAAREDPTIETLHEWRKQVKYLWHQLQMLELIQPRWIRSRGNQTHQLADYLGEDHDLAILAQRLQRARRGGQSDALERVAKRIDRKRAGLQGQAMKLGTVLYGERPRKFAKRLACYAKSPRAKNGA